MHTYIATLNNTIPPPCNLPSSNPRHPIVQMETFSTQPTDLPKVRPFNLVKPKLNKIQRGPAKIAHHIFSQLLYLYNKKLMEPLSIYRTFFSVITTTVNYAEVTSERVSLDEFSDFASRLALIEI